MRLDQRKLQQTNGGVLVVFPPRLGASARKPHRFCTTSFHVITQSRSNLGIICRFPEASKNTLVSPLARVFAAIVSEAEPLMSAPRYAGLIHGPLLPRSAFSPLCVGDKPLPSRETQRHQQWCLLYSSTCMLVLRLQSKKRTNPKAKQTLLCLRLSPRYLRPSGRSGVCAAAVIGPLCSASGPSLIFITHFINKQINRHISGEDEGRWGVCFFFYLCRSLPCVRLETNVVKERPPFDEAIL